MKIAHIADIHDSMKADKHEEVVKTTAFAAEKIEEAQPDLIVVAGDTFDEHDGRIPIDSNPLRYIVGLMKRFSYVAPVIVLRGTPSHDREDLHILRHIDTIHPIYVADRFEQIVLCDCNGGGSIWRKFGQVQAGETAKAVITCLPSPDKSKLLSGTNLDIEAQTLSAKEILHDAMAYFGEINKKQDVPKIAVGHGTITGASTGTGWEAVGQDLEYDVTMLQNLCCDLTCFGHFHKAQEFAGKIFYSGSPGRLNFGETEDKGFYFHEIDDRRFVTSKFVKTPARRFSIHEYDWESELLNDGKEKVDFMEVIEIVKGDCYDSDLRLRVRMPEEHRHAIQKDQLEETFRKAGANVVKVEVNIIPKVRQRAEGISRLETLPEKIARWGEVTGEAIPERVMKIAENIEGESTGELVAAAHKVVGL